MAIYRRTGTPIHPMSPLVKLAWLRDEQPQVFAAATRFIGIKEFVFQRFFDRYIVESFEALGIHLPNGIFGFNY